MFEKLKNLRLHVTLSAVLTLILGVVLILHPTSTIYLIAKIVGGILAVVGGIVVVGSLTDSGKGKTSGIVVGAIILLVGVAVLLKPYKAASIIPAIIGVFLILHGVENANLAWKTRSANGTKWAISLVIAVLTILCGLACIFRGLGLLSMGMQIIGAMLIYDGISSMFVVHKANSAERSIFDVDVKIFDDDEN